MTNGTIQQAFLQNDPPIALDRPTRYSRRKTTVAIWTFLHRTLPKSHSPLFAPWHKGTIADPQSEGTVTTTVIVSSRETGFQGGQLCYNTNLFNG